MKHRKFWIIFGTIVILAAVIIFMLCWNLSQKPHKVTHPPRMTSASAVEEAQGFGKETSRAKFTYHKDKKSLNLTSQNKMITASVFSYPEYFFTDPNALSKDPALFFMWDNNVGGIDDDMKNALIFAFDPDIRSGKIKKFNDAGKYQKGHWNKSYVFYTVDNRLTNYDYTDGNAHYNVFYEYDPNGSLKKITYSNSMGFSMDVTMLYKDNLCSGFQIHDSSSGRTTTEKWKTRLNAQGQIVSLKTDTRTYGFRYDRPSGYLTQINLDNRYKLSYSYGKGHRLTSVQSIVNINGKQNSALQYKFNY